MGGGWVGSLGKNYEEGARLRKITKGARLLGGDGTIMRGQTFELQQKFSCKCANHNASTTMFLL